MEEYNQRETGEGIKFRNRKKIRVSCEECGAAMLALALCHHMGRIHRIVIPQTQGAGVCRGGAEIYVASFPRALKKVVCLVDM